MEEPITPKNILDIYKNEHTPTIEKIISLTIERINQALKSNSDSIVRDGSIILTYKDILSSIWLDVLIDKITINGKKWDFQEADDRKDFIYVIIYGVFTEWEVKMVNTKTNPHFKFSSKEHINKNIEIKLEAKEEKPIVPDEIIDNRAEILDLGEQNVKLE